MDEVTRKAAFPSRDGAGALAYKGRMWLIGGWNPNDKKYFPRDCVNDVWSSTDGKEWVLEKPNTFTTTWTPGKDWEGTHTAGYVVHQGRMWIIGGDPLQGHYQPDVWSSDDDRNWHFVNRGKPVPWCPRVLHYTVAFQNRIWVVGGQTLPQFAPADEVVYHDVWSSGDGVR